MNATLEYYWAMCQSCAQGVYGHERPTAEYATRVARLLFGTGAHESQGFRYSRQKGFTHASKRGAWGYWQQEQGSILDATKQLTRSPALREHAAAWLFETETPQEYWYANTPITELLSWTALAPRVSLLWARLHYLRNPEAVPETVEAMASYWGRVYNTRNEAEKNAQFARTLERALQEVGGGMVA